MLRPSNSISGRVEIAEFDERRQDVDVGGEILDGFPGLDVSIGPADDERDSVTAFVFRVFHATHAAVVTASAFQAACRSVVGHKNQDRIVGDPLVIEHFHELGHVVVDVGDHAVELWDGDLRVPFVGLAVFLGTEVRAVRGVGRDIGEKRFVFVCLDKLHAFIEPNVGAETFKSLVLSVDDVSVIEIVVAPIIGCLADAAGFVVNAVLEAPVFRAIGIAVAEMPFTEQPRGITIRTKDIGHGGFTTAQHVASLNGVPDTNTIGVTTGHQGRSCRGTGGVDVKVVQQRSLLGQLVDVRRLDRGIAGEGQIAVTLVIRDDDDNVGLPFIVSIDRGHSDHHQKGNLKEASHLRVDSHVGDAAGRGTIGTSPERPGFNDRVEIHDCGFKWESEPRMIRATSSPWVPTLIVEVNIARCGPPFRLIRLGK